MQNKSELCVQAQTNGTTYYQRYVSTVTWSGGWETELGAEMEAQEGEGEEEVFSVQDWEAIEGKCICGGYWNIVSVNQCQSSGDRYSPRGTVSVAMLLCYCLAGSDRLHPMIDIRSAVTPFN
ncbi:hypothetical protein T06_9812 [Trichinella sp. T6]|nr:hypothetical protein T06_9812 [Trichinella sp. T6]